jgi:hypothetical protein
MSFGRRNSQSKAYDCFCQFNPDGRTRGRGVALSVPSVIGPAGDSSGLEKSGIQMNLEDFLMQLKMSEIFYNN